MIAAFLFLNAAFAAEPGILRITLGAEPKTLDPLMVADDSSELVRFLTHGVLIRMNRTRQAPEPELAESWSAARDGRGISFHIRPGLVYSDGTAFDSADVCYTLDRLTQPNAESASGEPFRFERGKLECAAAGSTVTLRFPVAVAGVERLFDSVPILSSHSPRKDQAVLGPFMVAEIESRFLHSAGAQRSLLEARFHRRAAPLPEGGAPRDST